MLSTPAVGDLRHQRLFMLPSDVTDLWTKDFLTTNLIDFLFQNVLRVTPTDNTALFIGPTLFPMNIATAEYEVFLEAQDETRKTHKANLRRVARRKKQLNRFLDQVSTFIAPVIEAQHFFVLKVVVDPSLASLYKDVTCYDSFVDGGRSGTQATRNSKAMLSMTHVDKWLRHYIYEKFLTKTINFEGILKYSSCPRQFNTWDCGLFSLGVALYLSFGFPVDADIFTSKDVASLRTDLAHIGLSKPTDTKRQALQVSAVLDAFNLAIVGGPLVVKPKRTVLNTKRVTRDLCDDDSSSTELSEDEVLQDEYIVRFGAIGD